MFYISSYFGNYLQWNKKELISEGKTEQNKTGTVSKCLTYETKVPEEVDENKQKKYLKRWSQKFLKLLKQSKPKFQET